MAATPIMNEYANRTAVAVRRWNTTMSIPDDADDERLTLMIRSALIRAAQEAEKYAGGPFYPDDHSWSHSGFRGLTIKRIREEVELSRDKMAPAQEEWGIVAHVAVDGLWFYVPFAIDLDESAARNIVLRLEGSEDALVETDMLSSIFGGKEFKISIATANWSVLREQALEASLMLDEAMIFRRPVIWDLLRAAMSDLPPVPFTPFDIEEFSTRFAKSCRYDTNMIQTNKNIVESFCKAKIEPMTAEWSEWHPCAIDLLNSIGPAQPMDGISIILNFVVEEPVAGGDLTSEGGETLRRWAPVSYHNMIVAYGLHPVSAAHLLDLVRRDPDPFYDLPDEDLRRYTLVGASAIQDTMLSKLRVSATGRTDAYEAVAAVPLIAS